MNIVPFKSPFPPPNERQREILIIMIEEAAEVIQRATKALRFGLQEVQPGQYLSNRERLAHELGDLDALVTLAIDEHLIDSRHVTDGTINKQGQLAKYMQTEPESH